MNALTTGSTHIEFWIDAACPFCWTTARWVVDEVQPHAAHCGGITVTHRVAELAEARHVGLLVHTGAADC